MLETASATQRALDHGVAQLLSRQGESGSLRGEYDGPLFLTPGYVFASYATGTPIPQDRRAALLRYIEAAQNRDGGFGLHLEGPSLLFTTVLSYVAIRLLGGEAPRALAWIRARGGAAAIPTWGKCWLAILGLYDWRGVPPMPPELWLLPRWLPAHPGRMWCHARVVYLALSYLNGRRWRIAEDPLIAAVRAEIFPATPDWRSARDLLEPGDVHVPRGRALRVAQALLSWLDPHVPRWLRRRALARVLDAIEHEETTASFIALGPVNKTLDVVALHAARSPLAEPAIDGMAHYLFTGERGLTMQAYDFPELWETALAVQALVAADRVDGFADGARRFILDTQLRTNDPRRWRYHRDASRGGWPFSTAAHAWPVVDCTAEGLRAALALGGIEEERVREAVDRLLAWQNDDGGWPTYERRRAPAWLERLNPSELFADIMVDHSFVELTASAMCGLVAATRAVPGYRAEEIRSALARGEGFVRTNQRADGSWEGSWGICFTYGTWWAVRALRTIGASPRDPALRHAVGFLVERQFPDGGWGESFESCVRRTYIQHPDGSQPVMTAWALLALLEASSPAGNAAVARGVEFLVAAQREDGDWPQRAVTGVFNRTCMLHYRFYRNVFPIWALAAACRRAETR